VRLAPATKLKLNRACEQSDRSLSQEAETRLEQSFDDVFGSPEVRAFFGHLAFIASQRGGHKWLSDREAFNIALTAIVGELSDPGFLQFITPAPARESEWAVLNESIEHALDDLIDETKPMDEHFAPHRLDAVKSLIARLDPADQQRLATKVEAARRRLG